MKPSKNTVRISGTPEAPGVGPLDRGAVALHPRPDPPVVGLAGLERGRGPGVGGFADAAVDQVPPDGGDALTGGGAEVLVGAHLDLVVEDRRARGAPGE